MHMSSNGLDVYNVGALTIDENVVAILTNL